MKVGKSVYLRKQIKDIYEKRGYVVWQPNYNRAIKLQKNETLRIFGAFDLIAFNGDNFFLIAVDNSFFRKERDLQIKSFILPKNIIPIYWTWLDRSNKKHWRSKMYFGKLTSEQCYDWQGVQL